MNRRKNGGDHFLIVLEDTLVHLPQRRQNVLHKDGRGGTRRCPCGNGLVLGVENVVSPHVFDELGLVDSEKGSVEIRKLAKREAPAVSSAGEKDGSIGRRNEELLLLFAVDNVGLVIGDREKVQSWLCC